MLFLLIVVKQLLLIQAAFLSNTLPYFTTRKERVELVKGGLKIMVQYLLDTFIQSNLQRHPAAAWRAVTLNTLAPTAQSVLVLKLWIFGQNSCMNLCVSVMPLLAFIFCFPCFSELLTPHLLCFTTYQCYQSMFMFTCSSLHLYHFVSHFVFVWNLSPQELCQVEWVSLTHEAH